MAGPAPAVAAIRSAVTAATAGLPDGSLVLVACSGGPDSLALAACTAFVAQRSVRMAGRPHAGPLLRVGAVVVDHGLQADSAEVAATAGIKCRRLGLDPVAVVRVEVGRTGGPEAAAREVRYAALERAAEQSGAAMVLLGHTLDDQAETVLMGLARGSGARSLAGMRSHRGLIVRPMLGLRRSDTLAACEALGLDPWHDPTNSGLTPAGAGHPPRRSRVRAEVVPVIEDVLGPGAVLSLARTADLLRADADALDSLANSLLIAATVGKGAEGRDSRGVRREPPPPPRPGQPQDSADVAAIVLDVEILGRALPAIRRRALRTAALASGAQAGSLTHAHIDAIDALVTRWHGQGIVALSGRVQVRRAYGRLEFHPGQEGPERAENGER
ncbi:tRNA lysidine(34) synthetase TilS [Cellulomonas cellasea]|uniref:tRNA lysidine(34) synthetase TilS n=1 Tax=Cellulomonas cellasea TaxID=43670 RepID=UPI0025A4C55A|nr:tRNA lysidine(34) synthetase TilS [Cellulomonas cellasea]MDM8083509.1 tRNA lysidine(34) synthetase TilS [Cellulomonas cellasea]